MNAAHRIVVVVAIGLLLNALTPVVWLLAWVAPHSSSTGAAVISADRAVSTYCDDAAPGFVIGVVWLAFAGAYPLFVTFLMRPLPEGAAGSSTRNRGASFLVIGLTLLFQHVFLNAAAILHFGDTYYWVCQKRDQTGVVQGLFAGYYALLVVTLSFMLWFIYRFNQAVSSSPGGLKGLELDSSSSSSDDDVQQTNQQKQT
jgi:hypothetical protein